MTLPHTEDDVMPVPPKTHLDETHHIFDRVTRVETQVASLSASVSSLAESVGSVNDSLGELKSMLGGVGKTDGKTIVTLGATVIGAMVMVGTIFLGPMQRDVAYLDHRISEVSAQRAEVQFAELKGKDALVEWRLRALEEKKP